MKKIIIFLIVVTALILTVPVVAKNEAPSGEQINVRIGDEAIIYPANTPFYIRHGWMSSIAPGEPPDVAKFAKSGFALEVDGVYIDEDYIDIVRAAGDEPGNFDIFQYFYFIFAEGMEGMHTFTGHWYIECKWMETEDIICVDPNEIIEPLARTITITFLEP
jgi:hypothetical protein